MLRKFVSIESVMPSSHLILCCPLVLPPSIFRSIGVFYNKLALLIWCQTTGVFASASVLPMNIQDWFPLGLTSWISLQYFPWGATHCPLVALWEIAGALQSSMGLSAEEATISCHIHSLAMRVNQILQVSMFGGSHLVQIVVLTMTQYITFQLQNFREWWLSPWV